MPPSRKPIGKISFTHSKGRKKSSAKNNRVSSGRLAHIVLKNMLENNERMINIEREDSSKKKEAPQFCLQTANEAISENSALLMSLIARLSRNDIESNKNNELCRALQKLVEYHAFERKAFTGVVHEKLSSIQNLTLHSVLTQTNPVGYHPNHVEGLLREAFQESIDKVNEETEKLNKQIKDFLRIVKRSQMEGKVNDDVTPLVFGGINKEERLKELEAWDNEQPDNVVDFTISRRKFVSLMKLLVDSGRSKRAEAIVSMVCPNRTNTPKLNPADAGNSLQMCIVTLERTLRNREGKNPISKMNGCCCGGGI